MGLRSVATDPALLGGGAQLHGSLLTLRQILFPLHCIQTGLQPARLDVLPLDVLLDGSQVLSGVLASDLADLLVPLSKLGPLSPRRRDHEEARLQVHQALHPSLVLLVEGLSSRLEFCVDVAGSQQEERTEESQQQLSLSHEAPFLTRLPSAGWGDLRHGENHAQHAPALCRRAAAGGFSAQRGPWTPYLGTALRSAFPSLIRTLNSTDEALCFSRIVGICARTLAAIVSKLRPSTASLHRFLAPTYAS